MDVGEREEEEEVRLFLHGSNANVNSCCVRSELVGQFERVRSSIVLLHPRDNEGGQVLRGLDVEAPTSRHLDGSSPARPLDVLSITREGAGNCQDFAWFDADVFWQSLNPGSTTWNQNEACSSACLSFRIYSLQLSSY